MSDNASIITACLTGLLFFAILMGGPVTCSILQTQEWTKQVESACAGDLGKDAARSAACALALTKRGINQ